MVQSAPKEDGWHTALLCKNRTGVQRGASNNYKALLLFISLSVRICGKASFLSGKGRPRCERGFLEIKEART
jgi:hypothetical protein